MPFFVAKAWMPATSAGMTAVDPVQLETASALPGPHDGFAFALPDDRLAVRRDLAAQARAVLRLATDDKEPVLVELGPLRHARTVGLFRLERILRLGEVQPRSAGRAVRRDVRDGAAVRRGIVLDEPQPDDVAGPAAEGGAVARQAAVDDALVAVPAVLACGAVLAVASVLAVSAVLAILAARAGTA